MKTLLFLNGPEGCQAGIEDGFSYLKNQGKIIDLKWFYFHDYSNKNGKEITIREMVNIAHKFQPDLIVIFHIGKFIFNKKDLESIKKIASNPKLVYDEGDMYGGIAKPITTSMKTLMRYSDYVSIRGLGSWLRQVSKYNTNVVYTPHSNNLFRFSKNIILPKTREKKITFIGNKITSIVGNIKRLPGAYEREKLVCSLDKDLNKILEVYGKGWSYFKSSKGILPFNDQVNACLKNWFHISYEHYPSIPFYFSDRLPIALSCGQIYICHYQPGYEDIFKNTDFIYFFKTNDEAKDIIKYLMTLNEEQLFKKSNNAKIWANQNLSPTVVWHSLIDTIYKQERQ